MDLCYFLKLNIHFDVWWIFETELFYPPLDFRFFYFLWIGSNSQIGKCFFELLDFRNFYLPCRILLALWQQKRQRMHPKSITSLDAILYRHYSYAWTSLLPLVEQARSKAVKSKPCKWLMFRVNLINVYWWIIFSCNICKSFE